LCSDNSSAGDGTYREESTRFQNRIIPRIDVLASSSPRVSKGRPSDQLRDPSPPEANDQPTTPAPILDEEERDSPPATNKRQQFQTPQGLEIEFVPISMEKVGKKSDSKDRQIEQKILTVNKKNIELIK
jgi:hypothetical protein